MKTLLAPLKTAALSLCLVAGLGACRADDTETIAPPTNEQKEAAPTASENTPSTPSEQYAEGELRSVDLSAKTFVLRDSNGTEQRFNFSDITRILGAPSVQGLTGKQGSRARVGYVSQGDLNTAIWIEILATNAAPAQNTPPAQKY